MATQSALACRPPHQEIPDATFSLPPAIIAGELAGTLPVVAGLVAALGVATAGALAAAPA